MIKTKVSVDLTHLKGASVISERLKGCFFLDWNWNIKKNWKSTNFLNVATYFLSQNETLHIIRVANDKSKLENGFIKLGILTYEPNERTVFFKLS